MKDKKRSAAAIIGFILFVTLALSILYSFVRFLMAPVALPPDTPFGKVKSDYLLMLLQCVLGLNMQKFRLVDGTVLAGHKALRDTMKDIIIDALSAFGISVIGYIYAKRNAIIEAKNIRKITDSSQKKE